MPCAGRASSARGNRANRRCRAGALTPSCSSKPFSSSKRGQQRPGLQAVAVVGIRDQPDDAAAAPDLGFELEDRLDRSRCRRASPCAARRDRDRSQSRWAPRCGPAACSAFRMASRAVEGLEVPAQRQHVAPVAVGMEQRLQQRRRRASPSASSNCASQFSAATEMSSVLSSMRVSRHRPSVRRFPASEPIPIRDGAERA